MFIDEPQALLQGLVMSHLIDSRFFEATFEQMPVEHIAFQNAAQRHVFLCFHGLQA